MQYKFKRSIVGGTFDRFHLGHGKLLQSACEQSEYVIIGIATDELFKGKSYADIIEDFTTRKNSVSDFLSQQGLENRYEIVPIHDFYGTSLEDQNLDAIFITESNEENVMKMNKAREEKGFKPLEISIVPYVMGNDDEIISSERIRKGEIDRQGNSYIKLFASQETFVLPEDKREEFRAPIGPLETEMRNVIASLDSKTLLIAVGDIVAQTLSELGRTADISVIDGKTRREVLMQDLEVSFSEARRKTASNPAGTITQKAAISLHDAIADYETTHQRQLIVISGEEDLLAIPSILFSPLHAVVVYGQFDQGIVVVKASEQNKKRVYDLFRKFQ
jgi:pantetheine-phosphate adenylyltransferase